MGLLAPRVSTLYSSDRMATSHSNEALASKLQSRRVSGARSAAPAESARRTQGWSVRDEGVADGIGMSPGETRGVHAGERGSRRQAADLLGEERVVERAARQRLPLEDRAALRRRRAQR